MTGTNGLRERMRQSVLGRTKVLVGYCRVSTSRQGRSGLGLERRSAKPLSGSLRPRDARSHGSSSKLRPARARTPWNGGQSWQQHSWRHERAAAQSW
jgi:hypothetical protein